MSRTLFVFLFHASAAAFAALAIHVALAASGASMPAWLLIGAVAFLAAGPANTAASRLWKHWFGWPWLPCTRPLSVACTGLLCFAKNCRAKRETTPPRRAA